MRTKKKATIPISILIIPNSEWCPQIESAMAGGVHRESPCKGRGKLSSVTARESSNATPGDMSPHLVKDPSFATSAAVTATATTATTVSEYALPVNQLLEGITKGMPNPPPSEVLMQAKGATMREAVAITTVLTLSLIHI